MQLALLRWTELTALLDGLRILDIAKAAGGPIDYGAMRRHLAELDPELRETLAAWLAERPELPRDIARDLAFDHIAVARPVLLKSAALTEDDLLALVDETSREHHLAIAQRPAVPQDVAEFLVELGDSDVLLALLENPGVHFHPNTMSRLVGAALQDPALRAPVLARPELARDQARVLGDWGDAALRDRVADRFGTAQTGEPTAKPVREPVSRRVKDLIAALRQDDDAAVEAAFARLVDLPPFAMTRIIHNPASEPLAVVCRALSVKRPLYAALYLRLHGSKPDEMARRSPAFRTAMACFDHLQRPQAERVLATWRRAPVTVWHDGGGWHAYAHWAL
ncbi:MAG: DUF2336 domain-containing protein [Alphaproteobacteria bacterium]|jgi:uncharacterized protein (DUF2336 family)|nr:DUF2336 domain-containing protein [Alphaproteobacteria bacterium]